MATSETYEGCLYHRYHPITPCPWCRIAEQDATIARQNTAFELVQMGADGLKAENKALRELLREAYGYTTAADSLLPERIKAALQEQDNE